MTFDLPSESEGEDVEDILGGKSKNGTNQDAKSSFEKRQEKVCVEEISGCLMCVVFVGVIVVLHCRYMVCITNISGTSVYFNKSLHPGNECCCGLLLFIKHEQKYL